MHESLLAQGSPPTVAAQQHDLVRDRYRGYAPHYDRSYRRYTAWSRSIVMDAIADVSAPARVLDVCCGTGVVTAALSDRFPGAEVIGLDLSQEMLGRARERLDALGLNDVPLREAPAERLPVASESVDLLICANAFHLIERQQPTLAEFARVLVPGGRVLILDWTMESASMRLLVRWLHLTQKTRRRVHTSRSLTTMARPCGLQLERIQRERIPPAWGLMTWRFRK